MDKKPKEPGEVRLAVAELVYESAGRRLLDGVDLTVRSGEILGLAGVSGNGQTELVAALVGLLPAQRGVVIGGPYRLVRHPIYLGYLIGHIGFLLTNFSSRNLVVLLLLYAAQVVRILREESVLSASSPAYQNYQQKVRWRLVPGVF